MQKVYETCFKWYNLPIHAFKNSIKINQVFSSNSIQQDLKINIEVFCIGIMNDSFGVIFIET